MSAPRTNHFRTRAAAVFLIAGCSILAGDGVAKGEPGGATWVDDSGTTVLDPVVTMDWRPSRGARASPLVFARTQVNVVLDTRPWIGRTGRIHMVLPSGSGPSVKVSWTAGNRLLPGILVSGSRALVFVGPITGATLQDLLALDIETDGRLLDSNVPLNFHFEIEVDP